jgi:chemotaxis family two-component system response regulator Rcp1
MKKALAILLVEDEESDVELVARAINGGQVPCRLSVVHNGRRALDYLHRLDEFREVGKPDLILLDINMPGMDGKQLLRNIKQDEDLRSIPTVMLTTSAAHTDVLDCYASGVNCYVVKPFDAHKFTDVVRQVVAFWSAVPVLPSRLALMRAHH